MPLPRLPRAPRRALVPALLSAALGLSGCENMPGPDASGEVAAVEAGGRVVRVTPPEGFCVDPDSIRPGERAAFVLIEDCALLPASRAGRGPGEVPAAGPAVVNGLVTLSLGEGPLFADPDMEAAAGFDALERFLRTERGRRSAGMGGDPDLIRILETRRARDTLYVLVEDRGDRVVPVLGDRFWRAFTELNGRAAIASLGVFDPARLRDADKLAHLARVVAALKRGNGDPVGPAERALARRAPDPAPPAPEATADAPRAAGAPPDRPAPRAEPAAGGTALAPERAPPAPRRPAGLS